jgi:hypothetical protein
VEAGPRYGSVVDIHRYMEGKHDETQQKEELIEGAEIREEINAELCV